MTELRGLHAAYWTVGCFVITFLLYVVFVPRFLLYSSPPTGDQPFYLMDAASLAQDGDLDVKNNYDQADFDKFYALAPHPPGFAGMSAPYPIGRQLALTPARPEAEEYSFHPPGLPVVLAPFWWAGGLLRLWWPATIIGMCLIGALTATNLFLLAYEVSGRLWIAAAVWAALAFSSPLMTYSYLIFTELPTGLCLIYAFRRLSRDWAANRPLQWVLTGAALGAIPWLAWRCAPITAGLILYAALPGGAAQRAAGRGPRAGLGWFGAPLAGLLLLIPVYSLILYGQVWPNGKGRYESIEPVFHWPWGGGPDLTLFANGFFGQLFDKTFGLLIFTPVYVLAAVGAIALAQDARPAMRRLGLGLVVVGIPYALMMAAFENWTGVWGPPARYLTTLVPLLAAPLALALRALAGGWIGWLYRLVHTLLALPGIVFMAIMLYDARLFWPSSHTMIFNFLYLDAHSPFFEKIDFRPFLPSFVTPDEVRQPANSGWVLATAVGIVLLGYGLLLLRRRGQEPALPPGRRLAPALHGVTWVAGLAALGGGWYLVNYELLQHKTILTEQHRWKIARDPPLPDVRGIAYLEGKVYLASYGELRPDGTSGPGELGVIDVRAGDSNYAAVVPIAAQGVLTPTNLGDVKAGPDGLLYILANNPSAQRVFVMQPDGRVVRQIRLENVTPITKGLHLGGDGTLYIADMLGGTVSKFGQDGGAPLAMLTAGRPRLNNPAGVYATAAGTVYATESFQRVQELDPGGHLVRMYDLGCQPTYFAASAPEASWLEVSCDKGIRSIDIPAGTIQQARVSEGNPPLRQPTGLTYAPDGHLFVLDVDILVEYTVAH